MGLARVCPICHRVSKRELVSDHDHATGFLRGYICVRCNRGLAFFHENHGELTTAARAALDGQPYRGDGYFPNAETLSRAATYLQAPSTGIPHRAW